MTCHDFTCGNHGAAGEAFDAARHCRKCYGAARHPELAASLKRPVLFAPPARKAATPRPASAALPTYPCIYRGDPTGERTQCGTCGGGVQLPVQACSLKGKCVVAKSPKDASIACCKDCKERVEPVEETGPRLLLCSHYLGRTGAPIIVANLAKHLERGWHVEVHSPLDGPLRKELESAGVRVHIGDYSARLFRQFDLIVANTTISWGAVEQAKRLGLPCVWMFHESNPQDFGEIWAHIQRLIDYPKLIVYPCQATADVYPRAGEIVPSIVPPVPPRTIQPDGERFHVVTLGEDHPRKGQADIREAVAGDPSIRFTAVSGASNPHEWLQVADLYVCSSRIEAYPLSLQEAKAYSLPVITTPVYGCSEIIRDGIDGLHYQPGDVEDLRAKIDRIRTNTELRANLSKPLTHLPSFDESLARYDRCFTDAIAPRVVYHIAGMGPWWKAVVSEQLGQLRDAGLTRILVTHVGEGLDWLREKAAAVGVTLDITYHSDDVRQWECPAMRLIERLARESNEPILYLHSKGVSHDPDAEPVYHEWRRLMMRELIGPWRQHVPKLRAWDAVGVNWFTTPVEWNHFSGNFWLVRPSWIRRLPSFDSYYRDRYSPERWIGAIPGCKAVSLFCTDKRLWDVHSKLLGVKA